MKVGTIIDFCGYDVVIEVFGVKSKITENPINSPVIVKTILLKLVTEIFCI